MPRIVRSITGARSKGSRRAARTVTPPPHGLSRGNSALSRRSTVSPRAAHSRAAVLPAGPAPTTITSNCMRLCSIPGFPVAPLRTECRHDDRRSTEGALDLAQERDLAGKIDGHDTGRRLRPLDHPGPARPLLEGTGQGRRLEDRPAA